MRRARNLADVYKFDMLAASIGGRIGAALTIASFGLTSDGCHRGQELGRDGVSLSSPAATTANNTGVVAHTGPRIEPYVLAFGSCLDQRKPMPILDTIASSGAQSLVLLGDNVYADASSEAELRRAYETLAASPTYQRMRAQLPVIAVWDDHDYGLNDMGAENPIREASQAVFVEFFDEPADSPRRQRPGLYDVRWFGKGDRRVQLILLDTRYFRGPLTEATGAKKNPFGRYYDPSDDPTVTVLGDAQWSWLEDQLRQPAQVRIVVSSIQVLATEHPYEKWGNFPHERQRLFRLVAQTGALGVIFVSGDRHRSELSRLEHPDIGYPLYDLTTSSLNRPSNEREANTLRIGDQYVQPNFGTIAVDWAHSQVSLRLHDLEGATVLEHNVDLPTGPAAR